MKRWMWSSILLLAATLGAETAWQYFQLDKEARYLFQTEMGAFLVLDDGSVLKALDGLNWEVVAQLGETGSVRVKGLFRSGERASIIVETRDENGYQIGVYYSDDGMNWIATIDESFHSLGGLSLAGPIQVPTGWILATDANSHARIWHSIDRIHWTEVFSNDTFGLFPDIWMYSGSYGFCTRTPRYIPLVTSVDGLNWKEFKSVVSPRYIVQGDEMYVGANTGPYSAGLILYSSNGKDWTLACDAGMQGPGLYLAYANGTFVVATSFDRLYTSPDGIHWTKAEIDRAAINAIKIPKENQISYANGKFWYRVISRPASGTGEESTQVTFTSLDGITWIITTEPMGHPDTALHHITNPDYVNVPNPFPLDSVDQPAPDPLPVLTEASIPGFSLMITEIPEGGQTGLYLKQDGGNYDLVNTSWGNVPESYPFPPPKFMIAAEDAFVVMNANGVLGLFAPNANFLEQPINLSASVSDYDDQIRISWDPVPEATHYRVYRSHDQTVAASEEIAVVNGTEYYDLPRLGSLSYFYRVQALSEDRHSLITSGVYGCMWSIRNSIFDYFSDWKGVGPLLPPDPASRGWHFLIQLVDIHYYPWIWTCDHSWLYCVEEPGNLWLWDCQLGWFWTRGILYPFLYSLEDKSWVYFLGCDEATRWFYYYCDSAFEPIPRNP